MWSRENELNPQCGEMGHFTFQCMNTVKLKPLRQFHVDDVSDNAERSSSADYIVAAKLVIRE